MCPGSARRCVNVEMEYIFRLPARLCPKRLLTYHPKPYTLHLTPYALALSRTPYTLRLPPVHFPIEPAALFLPEIRYI